jgi:hypothetical protein
MKSIPGSASSHAVPRTGEIRAIEEEMILVRARAGRREGVVLAAREDRKHLGNIRAVSRLTERPFSVPGQPSPFDSTMRRIAHRLPYDVPSTIDDPTRCCADDFGDRFRAIVSATRAGDMRLDEIVDRDPSGHGGTPHAPRRCGPSDLPHAGQGAAQALEDAVALGRVLETTVDVKLRIAWL